MGVRSARVAAHRTSRGDGGEALHVSEGMLLLDCSPGVLELLEVQPPGGKPMAAGAYLRGRGLPGLA